MTGKKKGTKNKILLRSKSGYSYTKIKNPRKTTKMKFRKYDPYVRMHVIFEEARLVYQAKK